MRVLTHVKLVILLATLMLVKHVVYEARKARGYKIKS